MPSIKQLKELFHAISSRNWSNIEDAALVIAKDEENKGHGSAARQLRGALTNGTAKRNGTSAEQYVPWNALKRIDRRVDLSDVMLKSSVAAELEIFNREWQNRNYLEKRNLSPRTKLLFHGPPGCGKSITACAVGTALSLPVFVVRFDAIIASYLGQTAVNLRQLFQFVESQACVLLLDELDALGRHRGDRMDVGELDRIVISLMQELEHSQPSGIVIATSNLPGQLDRALWRRFDLALEFPLPTKAESDRFVKLKAQVLGIRISPKLRKKLSARRMSYAEAESLIESEARQLALKEL